MKKPKTPEFDPANVMFQADDMIGPVALAKDGYVWVYLDKWLPQRPVPSNDQHALLQTFKRNFERYQAHYPKRSAFSAALASLLAPGIPRELVIHYLKIAPDRYAVEASCARHANLTLSGGDIAELWTAWWGFLAEGGDEYPYYEEMTDAEFEPVPVQCLKRSDDPNVIAIVEGMFDCLCYMTDGRLFVDHGSGWQETPYYLKPLPASKEEGYQLLLGRVKQVQEFMPWRARLTNKLHEHVPWPNWRNAFSALDKTYQNTCKCLMALDPLATLKPLEVEDVDQLRTLYCKCRNEAQIKQNASAEPI